MGRRVSCHFVVLLAFAFCQCGPKSNKQNYASSGVLVVECLVPSAEIWVDGRFIGVVGARKGGMRLPLGHHRVEVRAHGYHPRYFDVEIAERGRTKLKVELAVDVDFG